MSNSYQQVLNFKLNMFNNPFLNTIILGTIAYIAIIFILRISGKRTLSKWNSFDSTASALKDVKECDRTVSRWH